jgi:hypothetical protein
VLSIGYVGKGLKRKMASGRESAVFIDVEKQRLACARTLPDPEAAKLRRGRPQY